MDSKQIKAKADEQFKKRMENLPESVRDYIEKWVPKRYQNLFSKVLQFNTGGGKAVIKAKCLDCVGFEEAERRIGNCQTRTCPLWSLRPFQDSK